MSRHPIPAGSLQRLRAANQQMNDLATMIAEAMGLDITRRFNLDLPGGAFVFEEGTPVEALGDRIDGATAPAF